jgi:hypothetical protein
MLREIYRPGIAARIGKRHRSWRAGRACAMLARRQELENNLITKRPKYRDIPSSVTQIEARRISNIAFLDLTKGSRFESWAAHHSFSISKRLPIFPRRTYRASLHPQPAAVPTRNCDRARSSWLDRNLESPLLTINGENFRVTESGSIGVRWLAAVALTLRVPMKSPAGTWMVIAPISK